MSTGIYIQDPSQRVHQGAIYNVRPIPWLGPPPLWLVRDADFGSSPRWACLYGCGEVGDAFRRKGAGHEEDVLARAKLRPVVVISPDADAERRWLHSLLVLPLYSLHAEKDTSFVDGVKNDRLPHIFHLLHDPIRGMREGYLDFRQIQPVHREWLEEENSKLGFCLAPTVVEAVLGKMAMFVGAR